jgi:thiamine-monophosphate kinase
MGVMATAESSGDVLRVAELGEFGLIDRLARLLQDPEVDPLRPPAEGEIAIGDDAACWRPTPDRWEILTTDALVEDVHFKLSTTSWGDLGWKALAENVSDVAAMGGEPRRAFVTLGLPGQTRVADLEALYGGMRELAAEFGLAVVGGDTVAAPVTFLSVSVVGEVAGAGLRRSAGRPGDALAVTGALGGSAGGLALLESGAPEPATVDEQTLVRIHRRPWPRVREGLRLVRAGVRCGMDLSDGLLGDAAKLAHASGVGVTISQAGLPIHPSLARRFGERAPAMALAGGEDYELLVAGPIAVLESAARDLAVAGLARLSIVGELTAEAPGRVQILDLDGRPVEPSGRSWDHFRPTGDVEWSD